MYRSFRSCGVGAALITALAIAGCASTGGAPTGGTGTTPAAMPAAAPVATADWKSVAKSDNQEVFVDDASIRERDGFLEAVTRYEYLQPQPYGNKSFQSARNVYRVDCASRRIADRENLVYAGPQLSGTKVGDATRSTKNLVWRDTTRGTADGAVAYYVCQKMGR
jgi:hypothetical protein